MREERIVCSCGRHKRTSLNLAQVTGTISTRLGDLTRQMKRTALGELCHSLLYQRDNRGCIGAMTNRRVPACWIDVDADVDVQQLINIVTQYGGATVHDGVVETPYCSLVVMKNLDYGHVEHARRYFVIVESRREQDRAQQAALVEQLLQQFQEYGWPTSVEYDEHSWWPEKEAPR